MLRNTDISTRVWLAAVIVSLLSILVLVVGCGDEESYNESSPCGRVCERLEICAGDDGDAFYDVYSSVGKCANECQNIDHDQTMSCMVDCDECETCDDFALCIMDC